MATSLADAQGMTSNRDKRIASCVKKRNGFVVDVMRELIIR